MKVKINHRRLKCAAVFLSFIGLTLFASASLAQVDVTATGGTTNASYTTLGGAFGAINAGTHTGTITIVISATTTEAASAVLNASGAGAASYTTISITPNGSRTITGTVATALIALNGADNVTIDGSSSGTSSRDLTIINTNAGTSSAVVWLQTTAALDGATNNTVKNVNLVGNTNITTLFGVGAGSSTIGLNSLGTGNNNNTIQNCNISRTQYGIYSQGASAGNKNIGNVITQNLMNTAAPNNVARGGILVGFENNIQITRNSINGITQNGSPDVFGITLGLTAISTTTLAGNEVTNATVARNFIGTVTNTGTFSAVGIGVASAASGTNQISNNMIAGVGANATTPDLGAGIVLGGGAGSATQVYFNSVALTGNFSGGTFPQYGLAIGGNDPVVNVRDNIFFNTSVNGTGVSFAIGTASPTFSNLISNFNDLFVPAGGGQFKVGKIGSLSAGAGTELVTLSDWQAATGRDLPNSISANPLFVNQTDLHLSTNATPVNGTATPIGGITIDIDGDTRDASTPDMGADERPNASLGNYPNTGMPLSTNTTVNPDAAPVGIVSFNVSTSTNFKGRLEGNPNTGVVRITDAHPAGAYTVTVTGFDNGGASTTKTFTLTVTTPATCNPMTFSAATDFSAAANPRSVAVGDFNRDGIQDLAIANQDSGNVSILLGNGAGGFGGPTNIPTANGSFQVAVGDFNGDGNQDLVTANAFSNTVTILLGNGAGGFSTLPNITVPNGPNSVAVGDFNGDGHQDLAIGHLGAPTVSILLGDGAGNFGSITDFPVNSNPSAVVVGDFNGDGHQDIATANASTDDVSILLGNGAGGFGAPNNSNVGVSTNLVSLAVGLFDAGTSQDLAIVNQISSTVVILLGNGSGGFGAPANFDVGSSPSEVVVGDFNGDGNQDLAVAISSEGVSVLLGNGAGGFSASTDFGLGTARRAIAVGDFNGDGKQDLATANGGPPPGNVSVLLRICPPSFSIDNVAHNEGNAGTTTSYVFTVTKNGPTTLPTNVTFATQDGTATLANNDYQFNGGTLKFLPADTALTVTVIVNGDNTVEPNETFTVHLSNPLNATISNADGTGTITNDDVAATPTPTASPSPPPTPTPTPTPATPTPTPTPATPTPTPTATPTPTPTPTPGCGVTFANNGLITIPAGAPGTTQGPANPYPANIAVNGLSGTVLKVTLRLNGLTHTFPSDIDVLLVGPGGQNAIVMSDVGDGSPVTGVTLTLDDGAATSMTSATLVTGTFKPTNLVGGAPEPDTWPAPAPAPLGGSALSIFNGTSPNGTWSLYVFDDASGDVGSFATGWELTITTTGPCPASPTPTPTPSVSPTATPTATPTPATPTPTPTPATPTPTPTPTATATATATPTATATATATAPATPTVAPTVTPTTTPIPTPVPTPTPTPTPCVTFSQSFDGVSAPALPAGWTTAVTGVEVPWVTSTTTPASAPNDAFAPDVSNKGTTDLVTPPIALPAGGSVVTFQNLFNMEANATTGFDGMVLEIKINGGAFADILTAGGSFVTGGYTHTISTEFGNPIAGRPAWSGLSAGTAAAPAYITTRVNLPATASGQNIQLKWRAATDISGVAAGVTGVRIDNIVIAPATCGTPSPTPTPTPTPTPPPDGTGLALVEIYDRGAGSGAPTPVPGGTTPAQAINLSTRMRVQTGENVGIGGFIITGNAQKDVLLRAIGPSLAGFGIVDVLADPVLELHGPAGFATVTNNNWRDTQEAEIQATGIPPTNDLESAILARLTPGNYTAIVRGNGNTSGVALVEAYDLSQDVSAKLANLSTRAFCGTGSNIVIAGFVLGNNTGDDKIIVRGLGPSLAASGLTQVLANPTLELRDSNGTLLVSNNDWQDDPVQAAEIIAAGLAPSNDLEAAIAATLPPGLYTALLAGL